MTDPAPFAYDSVAYPGLAYDYAHPDRLATVASLYGLDAPPPPRCRVLELGCGSGDNIIPMAAHYPQSEFVGVDLSETAIAKGNRSVADLGLGNIVLRHADITTVDAGYGRFDYIIAHGVYSWVPPPVREKLLSVLRDNLTPNGVAYVSYNCFPGSHLRDLTRDIMLDYVRDMENPQERVQQARGILNFVAEASRKDSVYGAVLRHQFDRVAKMSDEVLYHDDLQEQASAFLLRQVVAAAERHGLQYLSDATLTRLGLQPYPEDVIGVLDQLCGDNLVARHQYQDFIEGHGFRRTLLCHREVTLQRTIDPQCVRRYLLSSSAAPESEGLDPAAAGVATFKTQNGATITTDHPLAKAAILHLGAAWPRPLGFAELRDGALRRLGSAAASLDLAEDEAALAALLFRAVCGGYVGIHTAPPPLTTVLSDRPQASFLARQQVRHSPFVINQQHRNVLLDGAILRSFLPLVDGSRTVDALAADLKRAMADGQGAAGEAVPEPVTAESVEQNLRLLAKMALLVA